MHTSPVGRAVRQGLKIAASWLDPFTAVNGVAVLLYHRVGTDSGLRVDLPVWLFEEQMARIAARASAITLDRALETLVSPIPNDVAPVVVTFDDGTADFVDKALPILVRHGIPSTLYVATDFIESGRPFPTEGRPASWSGLSDALSTGLVAVGSHTHTHLLLDRAPPSQVVDELDRSISLIAQRLGVAAVDFAYPKALLGSRTAQQEVRARFRSAAVAGTRANPYGRTDPYRLTRSPIQVDDGLRFFERKVVGGMRLEDDLRRLVNRRRLAGTRY